MSDLPKQMQSLTLSSTDLTAKSDYPKATEEDMKIIAEINSKMKSVNLLDIDDKKMAEDYSKMISENKLMAEKLKKDIEKKRVEYQLRLFEDPILYKIAQGLLENRKSSLINLEQLIEIQLKHLHFLTKRINTAEQS